MDANYRKTSHKRMRSRSPFKHNDGHEKWHRSRSAPRHRNNDRKETESVRLPFHQQPLGRYDLDAYKAVFAEYLDIQKRLDIDALPEHEVKGRWKSFVKKWNRLELSEGWYDPDLKQRAEERWRQLSSEARRPKSTEHAAEVNSDDEDEENGTGYGPALPSGPTRRAGPAIPSHGDLQHRREVIGEDRVAQAAGLQYERKRDRDLQKERMEGAAPRADPGTRERQLEKKRATTAVSREYRDAKESGDVEVRESDLMGDDGVDNYKTKLKAREKVKNERDIRKEEDMRARMAEREERLAQHRQKEEKTMEMLRNIAKQRYG